MDYSFLDKEPGPKMLLEALKLVGTKEKTGAENNPEILAWAKECDLKAYNADEIPWCGLFAAVIAKRAGKTVPWQPLWARNWASFGSLCEPELGAVLVFSRGTSGHVGLYVGEDRECFHVLGGNQSDAVGFTRIERGRLIASRAEYKTAKPANVRKIILTAAGTVSTNEA